MLDAIVNRVAQCRSKVIISILLIPALKLFFSGEWIVEKITKRIGENAVTFSRGNCKIEKSNASMKLKVGTRVILYGWIKGEAGKVLVLARYVSTAGGPA